MLPDSHAPNLVSQNVVLDYLCFQVPQPEGLRDLYIWPVCVLLCGYPVTHFEPCDLSTRFMKVVSLGQALALIGHTGARLPVVAAQLNFNMSWSLT